MASRKEYEMLFQLNAQMGGNFTGTFSKAQQQILSMQNDIQKLHNAQGEITSYQKQQQAVEGTQKKLEVLQQQYDNIQREIQETGGFSSDLENKLLSKQQQIDKTSEALERENRKLNELGTALRDAGIDTANLDKESERLTAEMKDLRKQQDEAAAGARDFGTTSAEAFETAANALAAAGLVAGMKKIYDAYAECIGIAADFEASMSNVEALSGASAQELQQLSDMAKELGATTKFTAKESADAMGYMAMAGWSAEQMLSGMPGVLSLAAASGEDLAQVSDIVTDSMTAFGLTAADTSRYADVLAATAANANTSVGVMGETFKYAAPVAGALGYSIEDVSTAIGLMANAGIKGSNAGTALRNTFNGLLEGVTLTGAAFGEAEISAVRADGTMATLGETVDQLREYFGQMTEAERVSNASAIAGQRGYAGLLSILNATEADYAKLAESINNSAGAAQRMADVKMDNMRGQLTLLDSAWDAVKTTIGEQYTPALEKAYSKGAEMLSQVNSYLQENPYVIDGMTTFVGILGAATAGIAGTAAVLKVVIPLMKTFTATIPGVGFLMAFTAALAAVTGGMVALSEAEQNEITEARKLTETSREQFDQLQQLRSEYDDVCRMYGEASDEALYLAWKIDDLNDSYAANKQYLSDYIRECQELNNQLNGTLDSNRETYLEIGRTGDTTIALVHRLQELASQTEQTTAVQEEMRAIIQELNKITPELALSYEDVASGAADYGEAIEKVVRAQAAAQLYEAAQQRMVDAIKAQTTAEAELEEQTLLKAAAEERRNKAQEEYNRLKTLGISSFAPGEDLSLEPAAAELEAAKAAFEDYEKQIRETEKIIDAAQADVERYKNDLVGYQESLISGTSAAQEALSEIIAITTDRISELNDEYQAAYDAAYNSIHGQYTLWSEAEAVVAMSAGSINKALETQIQHWNEYNENLASLRERAGDIEGLSGIIASFADGSNDSVAAISGLASASDEDLKAMVGNWQELQKAQDETTRAIAAFTDDFPGKVEELTQDLLEQVKALDMSADAAENGMAMIQAFIDAAENMTPEVREAYAKLGRAAAEAINISSGIDYLPANMPGFSHGSVNTHGWISGAYASGTDYARAGLALVGEKGPELIVFRGGEQVIPAMEAEEAIYEPPGRGGEGIAGRYVVNLSSTYNIEGNANVDELEAAFREHDESLKNQLEELLDEIETDRRRRAYK